jgi:thiamine-triphosphatase
MWWNMRWRKIRKQMIEVEKKFSLNKEQEEDIKKAAEFVSEKKVIDTYFDNETYDLTRNDQWLRERNGNFELKICQDRNLDRVADQYEEIEDDEKIRDSLGIKKEKTFAEDIKKAGYFPFCTLKTIRSKYRKDQFTIDLDEVTSKNYNYCLAEMEMMVASKSQIDTATNKIIEFAKSFNINTNVQTRGKVIEFLRQKQPKHFKALIKAGVAK